MKRKPIVAVVGRSNAGKSTFASMLVWEIQLMLMPNTFIASFQMLSD